MEVSAMPKHQLRGIRPFTGSPVFYSRRSADVKPASIPTQRLCSEEISQNFERGNLATFMLTPSRIITEDDLTDVTSPLTKDLYLASVHADEITGIWRKLYLYGFEYTTTPQARYDAENTVQVKLKLGKVTDADVLQWLNEQPSKQGAIKKLIREAIKRERD